MDAEIQFFMSEKDELDFLEFAETQVDSITKNSIPMRLILGNYELLFTPSIVEDNTMFMGKLEIRSGNNDLNYQDIERAKSAFRKLRNKIKKSYLSRLAYIDKKKKDRLTPSRVYWLGSNAKEWKESDPENHILKLSKTSWMTFDIGY